MKPRIKERLENLNMLIRWNIEYQEYSVWAADGDEALYFTDDLQDARDTAKLLRRLRMRGNDTIPNLAMEYARAYTARASEEEARAYMLDSLYDHYSSWGTASKS